MEINSRALNHNETHNAKHFLYHVYAEQLGWEPDAENPSGWIVKNDSDGPYFDDMYNQSAQWFGVFEGMRQAASGRLLFPVDSKLEIELYDKIPQDFKKRGKKRVEMNRIAIDETYNGTAIPALLFIEILSFARDNEIDYIFTAAPEKSLNVIQTLNFTILHRFKYHKDDPYYAACAVLEVNQKGAVNNTIETLRNKSLTVSF